MAYWGTIKILNTTFQMTKSILNLGVWTIWGNQESEELKLAKENKIKLEKIEKQLQQFWAIQSGMAGISKDNPSPISLSEEEKNIIESMVFVDDNIDKNELIEPNRHITFHKPSINNIENTFILQNFYDNVTEKEIDTLP
jgi:hypothetical protein